MDLFVGSYFVAGNRVARWHVFKQKIPLWVNFGGSCNGRCCFILLPFDIYCGHLVQESFSYVAYFSRFGILYQEKSGNPGRKNGLLAED
jgi:hypothetical protein